MISQEALNQAKQAYDIEAACITEMKNYLDEAQFSAAVELLSKAPKIGAAGSGHSGILCRLGIDAHVAQESVYYVHTCWGCYRSFSNISFVFEYISSLCPMKAFHWLLNSLVWSILKSSQP